MMAWEGGWVYYAWKIYVTSNDPLQQTDKKINSENIPLEKKNEIQHFFQLQKVTADPPLRKPR